MFSLQLFTLKSDNQYDTITANSINIILYFINEVSEFCTIRLELVIRETKCLNFLIHNMFDSICLLAFNDCLRVPYPRLSRDLKGFSTLAEAGGGVHNPKHQVHIK